MARTIAKDHDQKRLSILDEAAQVFARDGITRASMSDVAKQCGISKATIYHYYESKGELIHGILEDYLCRLRNRICALNLQELTPEDKLNRVVTEFLFAYDGMDHQHKLQNEGLPLLPGKQQTILKNYQKEMVEVVRTILLEGFPKELGKDKTQLKNVTMSVFGMLNWFYMWHPKASRKERKNYAQTVTKMVFHGIPGVN